MKPADFKARLLGSLGANSYGFLVTLVAQLCAVPVFLHFWGKQQYGEWLVISTVPGILAVADFGFGIVGMNQMVMLAARGDWARVRRVLYTMLGLALALSAIFFLVFIAAAWAFPWNRWLHLQEVSPDQVRLAIVGLGLAGVTEFWTGCFLGCYRAVLKNGRGVALAATLRIIALVVTVAVVASSRSFAVLAFSLAAVQFAGVGFLIWDSLRLVPRAERGSNRFDRVVFFELLRPSFAYMLFPLGNAAYYQGLSLVVNAVLGAGGVVVFNTVRILTRSISQAVMIIKQSASPEFSHFLGAGERVRARDLHRHALEGALTLTGGCSAALLLLGLPFLQWWTHGKVEPGAGTLAVFLAVAIVNGLWTTSASLLQSTNRHESLALRYALTALLALPLAYGLALEWGVFGAALAMLLAEISLLPKAFTIACRLTGDGRWRCVQAVLQLPLLRRLAASGVGGFTRLVRA